MRVIRFVTSLAVALASTLVLRRHWPTAFNVHTDIIGYPIFKNFNPRPYFRDYYVAAIYLPLATFVIDLGLGRLLARGGRAGLAPDGSIDAPGWPARPPAPVTPALHALVVAALVGLEAGWVVAHGGTGFWRDFWVATAIAWTAIVGVGWLLSRFTRVRDGLAGTTLAGVLVALLGFQRVAAGTRVVLPTGGTRSLSWLPPAPAWVILALGVACAIWTVRAHAGDLRFVARAAVAFVVVPLLVFLAYAQVPGPLGVFDVFHEGETLVGARLLNDGAVPWRDVMMIHGPLHDGIMALTGIRLFGDTRWSAFAGLALVLTPLYWALQFVFFGYLFRRRLLFLLVPAALLVARVQLMPANFRFLLAPVVYLALAALLRQGSWTRIVSFIVAIVVTAVLTPEAGYLVLACVAVVVVADASRRGPWRDRFARTIGCAVVGAGVGTAWLVLLASRGALGSFLSYYRIFSQGHDLTGAVPMVVEGTQYKVAMFLPPLLVVWIGWRVASRLFARRPIDNDDWVLAAAGIFVALYYPKFLGRAELAHLLEVYAVALPLVFGALFRLLAACAGLADRCRPRFGRAVEWGLAGLTAGTLVVTHVVPTHLLAAQLPRNFEAAVGESQPGHIGYAASDVLPHPLVDDIAAIVGSYMRPRDTLFDFTNEPALFFYVNRWRPATRYYHVSMAIPSVAQTQLVHDLERSKPRVIVYTEVSLGQPGWDFVPNIVRHYAVSEYLLRNYEPAVTLHHYVFLVRKGTPSPDFASLNLHETVETSDVLTKSIECDWGYAPQYFSDPDWRAGSPSTALVPTPAAALVHAHGWVLAPGNRQPPSEVLALEGTKIVGRGVPRLPRPDIAALMKSPDAVQSGFDFSFTVDHRITPASLRFAVADGRGRLLTIGTPAVSGHVDGADVSPDVMTLIPPAGTRLADYRWLEVTGRRPLRNATFALSDGSFLLDRTIAFQTPEVGGRTYRVRVSSCPQWFSSQFESAPLVFRLRGGELVSGRLVR